MYETLKDGLCRQQKCRCCPIVEQIDLKILAMSLLLWKIIISNTMVFKVHMT